MFARVLFGLSVVTSLGMGCAGEPPIAGAPCPCPEAGYTCDETRGVCMKTPPTPDQIAKAAVLVSSCLNIDADFFRENSGEFLGRIQYGRGSKWDDLVREQAVCLSNQNTCQGLANCIGLEITTSTAAEFKAFCSNNVLELHLDGKRLRWDCKRLGQICTPEDGCTDPGRKPCNGTTFAPRCDDDRPINCGDFSGDGLEETGPRCSELGLTCVAEQGGNHPSAYCAGTGEPCDNLSRSFPIGFPAISCEGQTMTACVSGQKSTHSCGEFGVGFTCQSRSNGVLQDLYHYCGLDSVCDAGEPSFCDGDELIICNAGRLDRTACTTLGFRTCSKGVCL